jgi:hypothetical protein
VNKIDIMTDFRSYSHYTYYIMSVSIAGKDKTELLRALWTHAKPAAFFTMHGLPGLAFEEAEAEKALKGYIDYFCGRCIKTDLSGTTADPSAYDADWGKGSFAKIVKDLS